jgi:hypothetical protein
MEINAKFNDGQLKMILEEASTYMCACPAQVAEQIRALRRVYKYQTGCIDKGIDQFGVHARIVEAVRLAHTEMEKCLDDVLTREGWDRQTMKMPAGLRMLRDAEASD